MVLAELENISFTVAREIDGENKLIELITPNRKVAVPVPLMLEFNTEATPEQLRLRKFWLEPAE